MSGLRNQGSGISLFGRTDLTTPLPVDDLPRLHEVCSQSSRERWYASPRQQGTKPISSGSPLRSGGAADRSVSWFNERMAADCPPFSLVIPSDLAHVACARDFVASVCRAHGLDAASTDAFTLAVHEALNNAIRHSHRHQAEVPLEVRCYRGPDGLEVQVLDEGEPFDLASVPELDPAEMRVGGRGVFLMRALADEVSCHPRGSRGNVLRLVKRCAANSTGREAP